MISVSLIAGCPGLVPGWRAFPAIYRVLLPTPPPVLSRPSRNTAWARKDRGRGAWWQLRILAVYRAPPRHKTGAASEALNRHPGLPGLDRPHSKSLSSGRFQVFRHRRTSLWLAGVGFQAADAADEQVLSGHRRGLLHNTHICRCLEAYSSRGAFFSELQSGRIQAACSSSSRRRFFISMMRQQL